MFKNILKKNLKGFTLIELMIVVAIIGILAAVAIPKFAAVLRRSREASTKGGLGNLRSATMIYISENEGYVPLKELSGVDYSQDSITRALVPRYIEKIPKCQLGTYHSDNESVSPRHTVNRNSELAIAPSDTNGWCYTSDSGADWWVNCSHTDTKSEHITNW